MQATTLDMLRLPHERFHLPNGLAVVMHVDRRRPFVHLSIGYRVGSKDEPPGRTGFAHLFEHLMFTGTERLPGSYGDRMLDAGALEVNGATSHDHTIYHQVVPTGMLEYGLFAEADRMAVLGEQLTQQLLERERDVVLREKAEREQGPAGKVPELVARHLYAPGHPYHHTIIGTEADLRAATLADARDWCQRYYTPSNAVLMLAGHFDPKQARAWIERYFAHIPPGAPLLRPRRWVDQPQQQRCHRIESAQSGNPGLGLFWIGPDLDHPDSELLELALFWLNDGEPTWLQQHLCGPGKPAEHVGPLVFDARQVCGQISLSFDLVTGRAHHEIAHPLREALDAFIDRPPLEAFQRVRQLTLDGASRPPRGLHDKAHRMMTGMLHHDDPNAFLAVFTRVSEATPQATLSALRRWMGSDPAFMVEVATVGPYCAAPAPQAVSPVPAIADEAADASIDATVAESRLPSGAALCHAPLAADDLFAATLQFDRGGVDFSPREQLLAELAQQMMHLGLGGRAPADVFSELIERQLDLRIDVDAGAVSIHVRGPAHEAAAGARLLGECLGWAAQDDAAMAERFEQQRKDAVARLRRELRDARARAASLPRTRLLGPNHPLETGKLSLLAHADDVTLDELRAFMRRLMQPQRAALLLAGPADAAEFVCAVEANWPRAPAPAGWERRALPPPARSLPIIDVVDTRSGNPHEPVELTAACLWPALLPGEAWALRALSEIIGGTSTSRLNQRLREELRWTYAVQAQLVDSGVPGAPSILVLHASVEAGRAAACIQEIERLLEGLRSTAPPSTAEVQAFVRSQRAQLSHMGDGVDEALLVLQTCRRFGLPADLSQRSRRALSALQASSVADAANTWLDPARLRWSVAGDSRTILVTLRGTGRGAELAAEPTVPAPAAAAAL